jgi:HD superfamily phosphohydrolase
MNSLSASLLKDGQYIKGVLAVTWKGKQSAENILLARSQMFSVLYWHHTVRCAHAMLAHACALHLNTIANEQQEIMDFNRILYWGSIGEFLTYLRNSKSPRASELANWLSVRRLFKRAITLNFEDDKDLYDSVLRKKQQCVDNGDKLLLELSESLASKINKTMRWKKTNKELSENDIIVDIPKAEKDKLGQIYVIEKGSGTAIPYTSQGLIGSTDDWHNRVRTIRVFIDPKIDPASRDRISLKGKEILQSAT